MKRIALITITALGCGSVESSKVDARLPDSPPNIDAAIDSPPAACDITKPFGTPVAVTAVNTANEDGGAHLSADERTMYLASRPANTSQIYIATRASTTAAFGTPVAVTAVNIGDSFSPSTTTDELAMYLISNGTGTVGGHDVFVATRTNTTAAFGTPTNVANINSSNDIEYSVSVTGDGNNLYFSSARNGTERIWHSSKSGAGFAVPTLVGETIDSASGIECCVAVRTDNLELFFGSTRNGGAGAMDIWTTKRASASAAWGTPTRVSELSGTASDTPTWISADGCRIYFQSNRAGGTGNADIWYAERPR